MTKHTIEIEGLPEGWEPVAIRIALKGEHVLDCGDITMIDTVDHTKFPCVIVQKTKPREITLVETDEPNSNRDKQEFIVDANIFVLNRADKYWRIKE